MSVQSRVQYRCENERRRQAVLDHGTLNGIDFLEVLDQDAPAGSPAQQTLLLRFLKDLPTDLGAANLTIEGGVRITPVAIEWAARAADAATLRGDGLISQAEEDYFLAQPAPESLLLVRTDSSGDFSTYRISLRTSPTQLEPPPGFDPLLSALDFSFKVECPDEFDCKPEDDCPPEIEKNPLIDYLARDYPSLRRLILDRLAVVMPDWRERSPADLGIVLVELLAYVGDYLSYYQDGVATEAYLGTARRRTSLARHARLLDYPMHHGSNARSWVAIQVDGGADGALLPARDPITGLPTRFLTELPEARRIDPAQFERLRQSYEFEVFESVGDLRLHAGHNELDFYTWGNESCCLPRGATRATLQGTHPQLEAGQVLIFEEQRGAESGKRADADPGHRHAVRLTQVRIGADPLGGRFVQPASDDPVSITEIEWADEDRLPFPLCLDQVQVPPEELDGGPPVEPVSRALGNALLVDHGLTRSGEPIASPQGHLRYRPALSERGITQRSSVAKDHAASAMLNQDPRRTLPAVALEGGGETWQARRDLLNSDRFAPEFVVELENDGGGRLRFGDGRTFGRSPEGISFEATYRVGNGPAGNVGADSIRHVVTAQAGIVGVRNPLPAVGGTAAESLEEVRNYAPQAFRVQQRAVTEEDYATMAERHPQVQKAKATRRWTGSWYTIFLSVDRRGGFPVTAEFESELRSFLERFRLAGHDLEIDSPRHVPLQIHLLICVKAGYFRSQVEAAILKKLSNRVLADGSLGYFHPDRFTFGDPVYLSPIIATVMGEPGVSRVDVLEFQRWGRSAANEIADGVIEMERLEIARLDNSASVPENGKIELTMEGGM